LARFGKQFGGPLFYRRADEMVQRAGIDHAVRVERLAEAAQNSRFRVREGSIQVEDEGRELIGHFSSFAEMRAEAKIAASTSNCTGNWRALSLLRAESRMKETK
jgi:hypothetical protein